MLTNLQGFAPYILHYGYRTFLPDLEPQWSWVYPLSNSNFRLTSASHVREREPTLPQDLQFEGCSKCFGGWFLTRS